MIMVAAAPADNDRTFSRPMPVRVAVQQDCNVACDVQCQRQRHDPAGRSDHGVNQIVLAILRSDFWVRRFAERPLG